LRESIQPTWHRALRLFFMDARATSEIYTLSLHDALPISDKRCRPGQAKRDPGPITTNVNCLEALWPQRASTTQPCGYGSRLSPRSEEHTSELQSREKLVCRLLLEKKNTATGGRVVVRASL